MRAAWMLGLLLAGTGPMARSCKVPPPTTCGNGVVDPGEACDDGNIADGDGCTSDCQRAVVCGDGIQDLGEQCDDGDRVDGDGCEHDCLVTQSQQCFDSFIELSDQLHCARGFVFDRFCRQNCTYIFCGDGVRDPGEECDDGNDDDTDGCTIDCRLVRRDVIGDASCGDRHADAGELCFVPRAAASGPNLFPVGSLLVGDVDGDGQLDVISANGAYRADENPAPTTFNIFYGRGDGTFTPYFLYERLTANIPTLLGLADFNGDARPDLFLSVMNDGLSHPTVAFASFVPFDVTDEPRGSGVVRNFGGDALGDLDGDGDPDVITSGFDDDFMTLLVNGGFGSFEPRQLVGVPGVRPSAVADMNGDGTLDIIALRFEPPSTNPIGVGVFLNDGTGQFTAGGFATLADMGFEAGALAVGDLDGDGDLDVVARRSSDAVVILVNDGVGGLSQRGPELALTGPAQLADLDGDGDLDLVATGTDGAVEILRNDGTGSFGAPLILPLQATTLGVGDFDGDGRIDIVIGGNDRIAVNDSGYPRVLFNVLDAP